jgi:glycosyltransferase involved in cell wall biosynthesis
MPLVSVITPASRGVKDLSHLVRDFKNQTLLKSLWEHIIVFDGKVPADVQVFMDQHKNDYNLKFVSIEKDLGDMKKAPGTKPRNHGLNQATGDFVYFFDDDDRAKDILLERLISGATEDTIKLVQMTCQESRIYKNGNPRRIILVPEVGLSDFPVICHIGTPCFLLPRKWALEDPWRHESEHDFRFIKRIVEKHKPKVLMNYGMLVDVDGLVVEDLKDWVSIPPFYRGD